MTAKVKKIIRQIEALDPAGKDQVRRHLARQNGQNGRGKSLTRTSGNGYNPLMVTATLACRQPGSLGERIAERRGEKGISQEQLAAAIGISRITINRIENGHRQPNVPVLRCIAEALDITTADLLAGV